MESNYRPRGLFRHAHASTIIPSLFRRVLAVSYVRERIGTPDGDFLDLDWSGTGRDCLVVICHGLEGSAWRHYVRGMVQAFNGVGWDAVGMNFRGCSGEPNRTGRSYHSGATEDLQTVLDHVQQRGYRRIVLIGFSLGGNLVLKYLGRDPGAVASGVSGAVAFSAPVDLADSAAAIGRAANRIYSARFLRKLKKKVGAKAHLASGGVDLGRVAAARTLIEFDDCYTAPVHGFRDAPDYYARCSAKPSLCDIRIPTLLVSARNDPLLGRGCYPREAAEMSDRFFLEVPACGGHVGFFAPGPRYWSEERAVAFVLALEESPRGP